MATGSGAPSAVLLDTDVFSFLLKGDQRATRFRPYIGTASVLLSFVTVGELWTWAAYRSWGVPRQNTLRAELSKAIVVPATADLSEEWGRLVAEAKTAGHPLGQPSQANDAWIAATGRLLGVPLITGNTADFEGLPGLTVLPRLSRSP